MTGTTPMTLTFETVTQSGWTILATSSVGPAAPTGYGLGDPVVYYNVNTSANCTGLIDVCIDYSGIYFGGPDESLHLFYYENDQWIDCTTAVYPATETICGGMTSLRPIAIMLAEEPVYFADANLKQAVTEGLGLTSDPTPSDMLRLYSLTGTARGIVTFQAWSMR